MGRNLSPFPRCQETLLLGSRGGVVVPEHFRFASQRRISSTLAGNENTLDSNLGTASKPLSINSRPAPRLTWRPLPSHRSASWKGLAVFRESHLRRDQSQFCRYQAQRLLKLAQCCSDTNVRYHLVIRASDWLSRAQEKETANKTARSLSIVA
jgi:hypothetical protein